MSSPFNKVFQENSPLKQGGYVGGGDIAGAQYVPTGSMYANMFAKIGQAVADISSNKKKKDQKDFDKEIEKSDTEFNKILAEQQKERKELENTKPVWDGTKFVRVPKTGLNTVIPTTTKLG
jgi:hypothetical protein